MSLQPFSCVFLGCFARYREIISNFFVEIVITVFLPVAMMLTPSLCRGNAALLLGTYICNRLRWVTGPCNGVPISFVYATPSSRRFVIGSGLFESRDASDLTTLERRQFPDDEQQCDTKFAANQQI